MPQATLLNLYGSTEVSADVAYYDTALAGDAPEVIPIGRPIANTQLYVLDANQQLASMGAPGELYVGGDGLASGYLNRPALMDETFVTLSLHPQHQPVRLYRTGDQARWLPDGHLEFLGRMDHQVKLRG